MTLVSTALKPRKRIYSRHDDVQIPGIVDVRWCEAPFSCLGYQAWNSRRGLEIGHKARNGEREQDTVLLP